MIVSAALEQEGVANGWPLLHHHHGGDTVVEAAAFFVQASERLPRLLDRIRSGLIEVPEAKLILLRRGALPRLDGGDPIERLRNGENRDIRRLQRRLIQPDAIDASTEPQRRLNRKGLVHIVQIDFQFARRAIHIDLHAVREARGVISYRDVMRPVQFNGVACFHANRIVEPAQNQIRLDLAIFENNAIAGAFRFRLHPAEDRAIR